MENNSKNWLDDEFEWDSLPVETEAPKEEQPVEEQPEKQDVHVEEEEIPAEETASEEEEEVVEEQEDVNPSTYNFKSVLENLGFSDLSDEEISEADFLTMMEEEFDTIVGEQVKAEIEALRPALGDRGADLLKFLKTKQGSFDDYMKHYAVKELLVDIENEYGQESFARWYLAEHDDLDQDEIEEKIEELKEKEKLDSWSKTRFSKLKKKRDAELEAEMTKRLQAEADREAEARQQREEVRKKIRAVKEVAGLKLSDVEKVKYSNFALKPTVKEGEKYITPLAAKLKEIYASPEKLLLLSKIIESDFDLSQFKEDGKKEALTQVKKEVERRKEATPVKTKTTKKPTTLADLFED